MIIRKTALLLVATTLVLAGCNSPTDPSGQFPAVAGTYAGVLNWTANGVAVSDLTARLNVVQAGSQLTITGSITVLGQTIQLPAFTGNINQTGFFTATSGGGASTGVDPTCGTISTTSATLAFTGNTARYVENATTQFCGSWVISGTLTR